MGSQGTCFGRALVGAGLLLASVAGPALAQETSSNPTPEELQRAPGAERITGNDCTDPRGCLPSPAQDVPRGPAPVWSNDSTGASTSNERRDQQLYRQRPSPSPAATPTVPRIRRE